MFLMTSLPLRILALLVGLSFPARACIITHAPPRDIFFGSQAIYKVEAVSESTFIIKKRFRGPRISGVIKIPSILEEIIENWECTDQETPKTGEMYLLEAKCLPELEEDRDYELKCQASAWGTRGNPDYVRFVKRHKTISRIHLANQLHSWALGDISSMAFLTWLRESDQHADVSDWTTQESRHGDSLTAVLFESLSYAMGAFTDCPQHTSTHRSELSDYVLSDLLGLLHSDVQSPFDDPAYETIEVLDDLVDRAEDDAYACEPTDAP